MSRPSFRRTMTLEALETREVLSAAPDGMKQYALELLNKARTDPAGAASWIAQNVDEQTQATLDYYGVNLKNELAAISSAKPQQPLAWNDNLGNAAQGQSHDQASNNYQGHNGSDGSNLTTRLGRVGYTDFISNGEDAFAYASSVNNAMEAFLVDWGVADKGHRRNILQPGVSGADSYREVGIGIVSTGNDLSPGKVGPQVVTVDFGTRSNQKAQLLGVAFDDQNHNNFYDPTEGRGHVSIQVQNLANGQVASTETADAGGYQIPLDPGTYKVTAKVGDRVVHSQTVNVGSENVKVDFNLAATWDTPAAAPRPGPGSRRRPGPRRRRRAGPEAGAGRRGRDPRHLGEGRDPLDTSGDRQPGPDQPPELDHELGDLPEGRPDRLIRARSIRESTARLRDHPRGRAVVVSNPVRRRGRRPASRPGRCCGGRRRASSRSRRQARRRRIGRRSGRYARRGRGRRRSSRGRGRGS